MELPVGQQRYTFADCLAWDENERAELIEGEVRMLATPSSRHQAICFELGRQLGNYLVGRQCRAYAAPFSVRLFEREGDTPRDVDTVVEPDLSVICDRSKIDERGCKGAPDLIMEVLSPSTRRHDRLVKLNLYQRAGVREYWIVNPEDCTVQVLLLEGEYLLHHEEYGQGDVARVNVLEDCFIDLQKVFAE